jgi:hypothetical protein
VRIVKTNIVRKTPSCVNAYVTTDVYAAYKQEILEFCDKVTEYVKKEWVEENPDKTSNIEWDITVYPCNPQGKELELIEDI